MDHFRKPAVSPETALASDIFDKFCAANTLKSVLGYHRHLCELLHIKPTNFPQFYPKLKNKLKSWKAQALWNKFDKKASHKCYNRGKACPNTRVLIIGAGPCGLRSAIEAQLLGAKVVVIEKRDRISRNNVLHLWPFVIQDLRALGAKKFFGRFCAGSIDHISIRQLQCILLKVALIFGVEIHEGVSFESLLPPADNQLEERIGWRAVVSPTDHPVAQYEFDVLIGADGKRNTLEGFERKEFRGKLAIAITANFINKRTRAEARVAEISGVAFIFNQKFFKDLYAETGIDLENIVYYKDDTHYFVMTAKKTSLINKGVILNDYSDTAKLLAPENVDKTALMEYAKEAADFSTNYKLPSLEFAVNHFGQPDVAMFDFTSMYAAVNASRVVEVKNHKLLMTLVGDSLLEPFWPTGSGCARGFLSSMDACWAVRNWGSGLMNPLEVLAERESIYRILGQTTPENLNRDFSSYTLDPHTRYPNLNARSVHPVQVQNLFCTDDPSSLELCLKAPSNSSHLEQPKKRRRKVISSAVSHHSEETYKKKDSQVHPDTLLQWLKRQVTSLNDVHIGDVTSSFKDGRALCAIIHRYRPDLLDFHSLRPQDVAKNNQLAFDILERELGIPPVMTGHEMEECDIPDKLTMLSYLSQVYDLFRGEIPHIKHPKLDELNFSSREENNVSRQKTDLSVKASLTSLLAYQLTQPTPKARPPDQVSAPRKRHIVSPSANETPSTAQRRRKRRSGITPGLVAYRRGDIEAAIDKESVAVDIPTKRGSKRPAEDAAKTRSLEEHKHRIACQQEILENRIERQNKKKMMRILTTQRLYKSMQMLQANAKQDDEDSTPFEDYAIFLYRQTAPDFKDRVKDMEHKILFADRDPHFVSGARKGTVAEDFDGRVKSLAAKLKGTSPGTDKKPKDLLRAIGKIEKTDWNYKEIEKKIEESKWGKASKQQRVEKVPKWSRQQFVDKFSAVERKLLRKEQSDETAKKYAEIDLSLKKLTQKIKDGNNLEQGERGANKVSAMAAQLAKAVEPEKPVLQKSNSKATISTPASSGSELCHFCSKRVYLMERLNAEGRVFHRGCFRCEYCSITLRVGNYTFDRDGKYGNKFFCTQHFGMTGTQKMRSYRKKSEELKNLANKENILKSPNQPKTPEVIKLEKDTLDRGGTPERIEFENLDLDNDEDGEIPPSEMDEDEWTDRNFGASAAEIGSSDEMSDLSDSEEDSEEDDNEGFAEALDAPLTADETLRLAEDWTRRYSNQKSSKQNLSKSKDGKDEDHEDDSESVHESEDSQERFSYQEYDSEDDESETATEGEEELKVRELRKQEVRLDIIESKKGRHESESDTEVTSADYSDSSESESEEQNSATEISTDSEFERDETTPTRHEIPDIIISESVQVKRGKLEEPQKIQLVNGNAKQVNGEEKPNLLLHLNSNRLKNESLVVRPTPFINLQRGDYSLNRTASTEGIASKLSLELKKKYLLGGNALNNAVKKSGSASSLDTRFKHFVDHISEQQKLLNPVLEPSSTMQTVLQDSENLRISPTSSPQLPSFRNLKEPPVLAGVNDYQHVCNLSNNGSLMPGDCSHVASKKELNSFKPISITGSLDSLEKTLNVVEVENPELGNCVTSVEIKNSVNEDQLIESNSRPQSPLHETSIVVPEFHRPELVEINDDIDSDSLFSDSSCSEEEEKRNLSLTPQPPPKVEIHNSRGELMQEVQDEGGNIKLKLENPNGETIEQPKVLEEPNLIKESCAQSKMNISMPDVCLHTNMTPLNSIKNGETLSKSTESIDVSSNFNSKIITVPNDSKNTSSQVLKQVSNTAQLFLNEASHEPKDITSGRSSPNSPTSIYGDESTVAALTETELSDWARDEDVAVSDNIDDLEYRISPKNITYRRNQKIQNKKHARGVAAKIARTEDFEDDYSHVCGKVENKENNIAVSEILSNIDNIEFMDTGEEESSISDNRYIKRNSGYFEFVNQTDDEDVSTPVAINPYVTLVDSDDTPIKENADDDKSQLAEDHTNTTTTSDLSTVKPLNEGKNSASDSTSLSSDIKSTFNSQETSSKTYEDYVQRLQGKIFPFSNVRDSIDIRKSRRHKPTMPVSKESQNETKELSIEIKPGLTFSGKVHEKIPEKITSSSSSNSTDTPNSILSSNSISNGNEVNNSILNENRLGNIIVNSKTSVNNTLSNLTTTGVKSPSTVRKLEEISRERSKQKDLIHEMVMNKLIAEGKSPQERKARKSNRNSISPIGGLGSQNLMENKEVSVKSSLPNVSSPKRPNSLVISANDLRRHSVHQDKLSAMFSGEAIPKKSVRVITPVSDVRSNLTRQQTVSSFRSPLNSSEKSKLPQTPLTNPEAFSCPDIRKALFESGDTPFKTPSSTKFNHEELLKTAEKVRENARARVRLMSDSQLGLSPEEKLNSLRKKVAARKIPHSEKTSPCSPTCAPGNGSKSKTSTSISGHNFLDTEMKDAEVNETGKELKHRKDRERRKSIIQAVSDFFHKKSPTPSPCKTPDKPMSHSSSNKFMKFRINGKNREKSKDKFSPSNNLERNKSMSESEMRQRLIDGLAPPVPPPPLNYSLSRPSEDSLSELDETTHCDEQDASISKKQSRLNRKLARQAHLKRLRIAHEIQRQLEELEVKQKELEARGVQVEKELRGEGTDATTKEEPELEREWFELMRERNELRRYEKELMVRAQEMELEDRHARLHEELRDSMARDDDSKTEEEMAEEGRILQEMLEIVKRRDSLIALMEADRQRYKEEDKDFEAQMLAKGLQLTPISRKEIFS